MGIKQQGKYTTLCCQVFHSTFHRTFLLFGAIEQFCDSNTPTAKVRVEEVRRFFEISDLPTLTVLGNFKQPFCKRNYHVEE